MKRFPSKNAILLFLILFGFVGFSFAFAEDRWVYLDEVNKLPYYYDKESIVCSPEDNLNIWIKIVNANYRLHMTEYQYNLLGIKKDSDLAKQIEKPYKKVDMQQYEISCKRRMYRVLSAQWFYESDTTFRDNKDVELYKWSSFIPNSKFESIFLSLCSLFYKSVCKSNEVSDQLFAKKSARIRSGTGVIISDDGLILTAAHVVDGARKISISTKAGFQPAILAQIDKANDIALLKTDGIFNAASVVRAKNIKLGQSVFTIGFPNINFQGFNPKMTKGEISSLTGFQDDPRHWQISLPVQSGNSGGPLFDEAGNVVGLVLAKLDAYQVLRSTGDLPQNVNYAIKSTYIFPLLEGYTLPQPLPVKQNSKLESVVEKAKDSVVLIVVN
jgi:S1-C subfamily serine protease